MIYLAETTVRISDLKYEQLSEMSYGEMYEYVRKIAEQSMFPPQGYGFSKPSFTKNEKGCFVSWGHCSSCD